VPPRRNLRLDALVDIMNGDIKVHAHSYRGDEILMLMRVAEDFGFRINTFQHVLEGYKVADEMAQHGAMASTFAESWAYKVEAYDAIPYNMAIMSDRGVVVSVNSDSGERVRRLYQEAAIGMKYGSMSEAEALKMVTLNPAMQLGVDSMVGSIEVGKDADIAIFSDHPFAPAARVEKTLVDGKVLFDRDKAATLEKLILQGRITTQPDNDNGGAR
jgi:imidazolonepropionase-like amidohydrolase